METKSVGRTFDLCPNLTFLVILEVDIMLPCYTNYSRWKLGHVGELLRMHGSSCKLEEDNFNENGIVSTLSISRAIHSICIQ
jgi:hypothetical protein